ncbi:MAG: MATE family efflux transporter [Armatimonadota bacterium]|nr:MATE family efflux transporter [Armatimonadota bacterium]
MEDDDQLRRHGGQPEGEAGPDDGASEPPQTGMERRVDLTEGHLLRRIVLLAWPIVTASFLQWAMGAADIKMVGKLGPTAIAAVGQSRQAIFTFMTIVFAVATGTQVLSARYMGERDAQRAADVTRQAVILSLIFGVIIAPLGYWLSAPLLTAMGARGVVHEAATQYMRVYFFGTISLMLNFMIVSSLRGAGDTLTPLWVLLGINSGNILFDWLLIFGVGPFPELGVQGAAWAVVISRTAGAIILLWIVCCGRFAIHMPLIDRWRIDLSLWGKMFYIGVPSSIQGFTRNMAFLLLFWILNQTDAGRMAVAGYTVSVQIRMFGVMFGLALMSAAMTAVSQNMGAEDPQRAERSGWTVTWISVAATGLMAAVFIVAARLLIGFFTTDAETIKWGVIALITLSAALPFTGASMGCSGALRGAGDTLSPLYASLIFTSGVGPAMAYTLTVVLDLGPFGAWLGLSAAWVMQSLMVAWIFKRGKWKQIRL